MSEEDESADSMIEEEISPPKHIFYRDREEWKNIEPVPQDDGSNPVVSIAYSDKCEEIGVMLSLREMQL